MWTCVLLGWGRARSGRASGLDEVGEDHLVTDVVADGGVEVAARDQPQRGRAQCAGAAAVHDGGGERRLEVVAHGTDLEAEQAAVGPPYDDPVARLDGSELEED